MQQFLQIVLDYSEVWAVAIPLAVLLFRRQQHSLLKPVIIYVWAAFVINVIIDIIMAAREYFPGTDVSNNVFYNIHSVVRFACFSSYFITLQPGSFTKFKKTLAVIPLLFLAINFLFFEKFYNYYSFSGNLLTAEAYFLLIYCMLFYLTELRNDDDDIFSTPHFWIVTGLCVYVVINFFVFLFYLPMLDIDLELATNIWNVHNIAFIIFCIFLTKAFYGPFRYRYTV